MQLTLDQLVIPAGNQVLLKDIDWNDFEAMQEEFDELGKKSRFSYSKGLLELMSPLAVHEDDKNIISDLVKVLLEELDIEFRALGSVTLKNKAMNKAVEADECFYILHESVIRGKARIDLSIDPPPDLAIEIDITNRTHFDNYEKLGVPELWRYDGTELNILILESGVYQSSETSRQFPNFSIKQIIPEHLEKSKQQGRNKTMKAFRQLITLENKDF
ncbi:MAG: Uma2 family endonuclease [Methylococcaceae bacterium]|nr:Uma2 family endonuclease [Methylococcaceae bacterium]